MEKNQKPLPDRTDHLGIKDLWQRDQVNFFFLKLLNFLTNTDNTFIVVGTIGFSSYLIAWGMP